MLPRGSSIVVTKPYVHVAAKVKMAKGSCFSGAASALHCQHPSAITLDAHRITPADLPQVAIVITRGDYPRTTTLVIGPMCCKNELILRNNVGHRFALSLNPRNPPHERFCLIWFVDELQETLPSFHLFNTHRNDRKKSPE